MKKIIFILITIVCIIFMWLNYRNFYSINNNTFTVWKRWGGACYITPYPYFGIVPPKNEYIKTPNVSSITICIKKDSFIIFNEDFTECADNDSLFVSFNQYKYRHIKSDDFEYIKKVRRSYLTKFPFITVPR